MSETASCSSTGTGSDQECTIGVRQVTLHLPEDEGEGLGFRLTRTLWDPYPWVREVTANSRADAAGLRLGDCLLQVDGKDLLGLPVSQVASIIRGDGSGGEVSLLLWNCGVDPKDDPELLWCVGGGRVGERSRRALADVVKALACSVCACTATKGLSCARSHLYCEACWTRLDRCALCRETLPAKDSPYSRNLVAEQVFEAIATEFGIKDAPKKPIQITSAHTSPARSPSTSRKGQYNISMMNKKKTVQFNDGLSQTYHSDPNIHRSVQTNPEITITRHLPNSTKVVEKSSACNTQSGGNFNCCCQNRNKCIENAKVKVESDTKIGNNNGNCGSCCQNVYVQHKLVTRLRPACSLADLQHPRIEGCGLSRSLNSINLGQCNGDGQHSGSLDDLKSKGNLCESPLVLLSPPIYVLACEHNRN